MAHVSIKKYGRSRVFFCVAFAITFLILFVYLRPAYMEPWGSLLEHRVCRTVEQKESPVDDTRAIQGFLSQPEAEPETAEPEAISLTTTTTSDWKFNPTRDERAFGLSAEQCDIAFPRLFHEITRAARYRNNKKITEDDLDISWSKNHALVRAMIVDQQLYIIETSVAGHAWHAPRALAVLHAIHRAIITSPTPIPDIEFSFAVDDSANPIPVERPIWAFTRRPHEEGTWLMSEFGYWTSASKFLGAYEQIRKEIQDVEVPFAEKKQQVMWRGTINNHPSRKKLFAVTRGKAWADVEDIQWKNAVELKPGEEAKAISLPDHCQYQFLVHTEGLSYSGRDKYLQTCNSVVIMTRRNWIEPQHNLLNESNFVEVKDDFSDLEEKILELKRDQKRAAEIARAGVETFRDQYLTPAAQNCYWRKMMRTWADISPRPELWEPRTEDGKRKMRGTPFETFVVQAITPPTCPLFRKLLGKC